MGIEDGLIEAGVLMQVLDDDLDNDMCDYRFNRNGGDVIENDPLIIDLRNENDYNLGHIPSAIWIANAEDIIKAENIKKLKKELSIHIDNGGKNEIVAYCYTGHKSGLACGFLRAYGLNIKNLMYGYTLAWEGTDIPHIPYLEAPRENSQGVTVPYKNIPST